MPTRQSKPRSGSVKRIKFDLQWMNGSAPFYALMGLLFVLGQVLLLKGTPLEGIFFSIAPVLILGWIFFKGRSVPSIIPIPLPAVKKKEGRTTTPYSTSKTKKTSHSSEILISFGWQEASRVLAVLIGIGLAIWGQHDFAQASDASTLSKGALFYLMALVFFIGGFWPWWQERLAQSPLPPHWEWACFTLVISVAAFLRIYQIDTIPSGLFIDQGFQGYSALRILHEGWRPFYVEDIFHAYALGLYMLAGWFGIFGATDVTLRLFYVFLSLVSMPLIYWTFRQLAGPRAALLALFILAVMRWNINFSRNGFPTVQLTLYIFGCLAFLIYGLRSQKKWPFIVSAFFFAGGFYTYQAFKIFPLLLVLYAAYELVADRQRMKRNALNVLLFFGVAFVLSFPVFYDIVILKHYGTREEELSIFPKIQEAHSWKPFWDNAFRTSLMFNRQGDPNPRHNLQDYRMLDDISGFLLILGLGYALVRFYRRKYFYVLAGFWVMSLPCLFSIDAAHANRMFGTTPFLAFLIATPLAALWGRARAFGGRWGEVGFLILLVPPLLSMTSQNFDIYFNKQAHSIGSWGEYSIYESTIGRTIAQKGGADQYFISPRYYNHYTIDFYAYKYLSNIHSFDIPGCLVPLQVPDNQGVLFALDKDREGLLSFLRTIYPSGNEFDAKDPTGETYLHFFEVPAVEWAKSKGISAYLNGGTQSVQFQDFPNGLPDSLTKAVFEGSFYANQTDVYQFKNIDKGASARWHLDGQLILGPTFLEKGYHSLQIVWRNPGGRSKPDLEVVSSKGVARILDSACLTTLKVPLGWEAFYYSDHQWNKLALQQKEPTPDYSNGNDFPWRYGSACWKARLEAPVSGNYQFSVLAGEEAGLKVDGQWVVPLDQGGGDGSVQLTEGSHLFEIYDRARDTFSSLSLEWVRPDTKIRQVIPEDLLEPGSLKPKD